ncbi:hypothetical protein [Microvirga arabica]|uniref:hypothetical protein n=1 Tax=Microvirga arabica TaxID=1128671 RepID=UPI00193AAC4B|nr:hypothetical protein [Microvirga arabica]MBM1173468.1 hypothetical protein [Microvirga arabica]
MTLKKEQDSDLTEFAQVPFPLPEGWEAPPPPPPPKYFLLNNRIINGEKIASAGEKVFISPHYDYGLAREDTQATGVEHVSVTQSSDGSGPTFTVPWDDLG